MFVSKAKQIWRLVSAEGGRARYRLGSWRDGLKGGHSSGGREQNQSRFCWTGGSVVQNHDTGTPPVLCGWCPLVVRCSSQSSTIIAVALTAGQFVTAPDLAGEIRSVHMAVGQNQWYHLGDAPPIFEPISVGIESDVLLDSQRDVGSNM